MIPTTHPEWKHELWAKIGERYLSSADIVFVPFARVEGSERLDWASIGEAILGWGGGRCEQLAAFRPEEFANVGEAPVVRFREELAELDMVSARSTTAGFRAILDEVEALEILGDPIAEKLAGVGIAVLMDKRVRHFARRGLSCSCPK